MCLSKEATIADRGSPWRFQGQLAHGDEVVVVEQRPGHERAGRVVRGGNAVTAQLPPGVEGLAAGDAFGGGRRPAEHGQENPLQEGRVVAAGQPRGDAPGR